MASNGCPTKKWPVVSASIPFSASGIAVSGLEFRQASICVRTVASSSNVSLASPTILLRCIFMLPIYHQSVVHVWSEIPLYVLSSAEIANCVTCHRILTHFINSLIFLEAQTKFVLWSFQLMEGLGVPRPAIKRQRIAIKAAVVNFVTGSRWTAFINSETKRAT